MSTYGTFWKHAVTFPLFALTIGETVTGQSPPAHALKPATGTLATDFSFLIGVRELSDGRVLLSDRSERRVVVASFATGAVQALGRLGSGPKEYRDAGGLFASLGDSTIMIDPGDRGRWALFRGAELVGVLTSTDTPFGSRNATILGFSSDGAVLASILRGPSNSFQPADSVVLVSVHRASRRTDTVAVLRSRHASGAVAFDQVVAIRNTEENRVRSLLSRALRDDAVLFPDGWVAIVRRAIGRIEWRTGGALASSGHIGADVPEQTVKRLAAAQRPVTPPWLNPYVPSILPAPDGSLLLLRMAAGDGAGNVYDLIDRRSELLGRLSLSGNRYVLGFGKASIFVVTSDDDGLQRLSRHPWP